MLKLTIYVEPDDRSATNTPTKTDNIAQLIELVKQWAQTQGASPKPPSKAPEETFEQKFAEHDRLLEEGTGAWDQLMSVWTRNFESDGPQPDRTSALMNVATLYGRVSEVYIRERGGLVGACCDSIVRQNITAPEDAMILAKKVALNIVQVGSALALHFDRLLEKSMFSPARLLDGTLAPLDASPPRGGLAMDSLDFTRPTEMPSFAGAGA